MRVLTICVVGFSGFLRYNELANLRRCDIIFQKSYVKLFIESSNTDVYRDGSWVVLAKTNRKTFLFKILQAYIIHLLDRTETNIIFIWSGKVILGEAKPSPNITSPDQINMILGEVLSNKCFIIPAHVVCTRSIARFIDSDQEAIYQVASSALLYKFAYCVIYFRT